MDIFNFNRHEQFHALSYGLKMHNEVDVDEAHRIIGAYDMMLKTLIVMMIKSFDQMARPSNTYIEILYRINIIIVFNLNKVIKSRQYLIQIL
jgi:hypothetical protein